MGSGGIRQSQVTLERESSFSRDWKEFCEISFDPSPRGTLFEAILYDDFDKLIRLWPQLTYDDLNQNREPNGTTALHAAFYRNSFYCAAILLFWGCKDNIQDKYGRTAFEFIKEKKTYSLMTRRDANGNYVLARLKIEELESFRKSADWIPNNRYSKGHANLESAAEAKKMAEIYRRTDYIFTMGAYLAETQLYARLRNIVKHRITPEDRSYKTTIDLLKKRDAINLVKLYTLETSFYQKLKEDNSVFTATIFLNMSKFRNRAFKGESYRGAALHLFDLNAYEWAKDDPIRILEFSQFTSSSRDHRVAEMWADSPLLDKMQVLFTFKFFEECDTALILSAIPEKNLPLISKMEFEDEVLILPYTLFKVESFTINNASRWCYITLIHVPVLT